MFLGKSFKKELMDDFSLRDKKIYRAYKELHTINKFLGGNSVTAEGIQYFKKRINDRLKILDVGGGISDILYDLKNSDADVSVYSLDLNRFACNYQKQLSSNNKVICADALKLPVKDRSFDLIHSSLFLHHLNDNEIILLLRNLIQIVTGGIIINDLRRNVLAYTGIRILTIIFSKSKFVKYDGPLSVRRSFTKQELKNLFVKAGIDNYIIRRKWAFISDNYSFDEK